MMETVLHAFGPYRALLAARYRMLLQYRTAALAGIGTQAFWGGLRLMVLAAFYRAGSGAHAPIELSALLSYVWLGQALLSILPWNVDEELAEQVRTGDVAIELLRPLDLYASWFVRALALRTARAALRMIPMLVFAMLVLPALGLGRWAMGLPPSTAQAGMFLVSLIGAVLLSASLTLLMHVNLLYSLSGRGANYLMTSLAILCSGMLVPLPLFPEFMQPFMHAQPLRGLSDVPNRIYSGHIPAFDAWHDVLQQLVWTALFVLLGRWLLERARRRIVVQGG
jgi:viologen exporter family transport system permease protein